LRCTSSGNLGCAIATRLHQHLRAVEIVPSLKVTVMVDWPFAGRLAVEIQHVLDAVDSCSMARRRYRHGLRGSAGYCVVTTTVGGTTADIRDRQRGVGDRADRSEAR